MNTHALTSIVIAFGVSCCTAALAGDDDGPKTSAEVRAEPMAARASGQLALLGREGSEGSDYPATWRGHAAEPNLHHVGPDLTAATSTSERVSQASNKRWRPRFSPPMAVRHSR